MFERFTERARQVVTLAQDEARMHNHDIIETPHILLGLIREEEGLASRVLQERGLTVHNMREALLRFIPRTQLSVGGQIPFTVEAKKALELALREALSLGHNYIGTEHILLGVLRGLGESEACCYILRDENGEATRHAVLAKLGSQQSTPPKKVHTTERTLKIETVDERVVFIKGFIALARQGLDWLEGQVENDPS